MFETKILKEHYRNSEKLEKLIEEHINSNWEIRGFAADNLCIYCLLVRVSSESPTQEEQ